MSVRWRIPRRRRRPLSAALGVLLLTAAGAVAVLPQQTGLLDLGSPAAGSVRASGAAAGDRVGDAMAGLGDFDGDGARDLVAGAWKADPFGRTDAGSAYLLFGPFGSRGIDMGAPQGVVRIDGAAPGDGAGISVSAIGDFNGDGRGDLVVGAYAADNAGRVNAGSAYVVFGGTGRTPLDLASLGTRGIRVDGAAAGDELGASVAGVGDANGDGFADVLLGARGTDNNGRANSGSAYLVLGSAAPSGVDLANPGSRVVRIDGATANDQFGSRVAAAGDVNGDGLSDLLASAPTYDPGGPAAGRIDAGAAHVVFGSRTPADLDLGGPETATRGFRIDGAAAGDQTGISLAAVGDADGDGRGELLIGAYAADGPGRVDSGAVFFVRGSSETRAVDLADLGARSVRIDGALSGDALGVSVAAAGDVTGDGRGDLLIGANGVDAPGLNRVGGAYLVTALPQAGRLDLAQSNGAATLIRGAGLNDQAGAAVAGAGDLTGDGRPDVLIGSRYADPLGRIDAGAVDVVLGFGATLVEYGAAPVSARVGAAITPIGPATLRRTGGTSFSVSPPLPAGLIIDQATGVISGTPQAPSPRRDYEITVTDLAGGHSDRVSLEVLGSAGGRSDGLARRAVITRFRTTCARSPVVGQPCRIVVTFRTQSKTKVRVEVRRPGAKRALGTIVYRTRVGSNRLVLPARIGRTALRRGAFEVRLRAVTVPLLVAPARSRVAVTLRAGRSAR